MKISTNKWLFDNHPLHEDRILSVDWTSFDFNKIEDRHIRSSFRKSCKQFALIYLSDVIAHGLVPSPGTLGNRIRLLRRVIRWMISENIYKFKHLTENSLLRFTQENLAGKRLSRNHIRKYIHIFEKLWAFRGQYPESIKVDIGKVPAVYDLLDSGNHLGTWKPLPLTEALDLIKDSIEFIEKNGDVIVRTFEGINRRRGNLIGLNKQKMREVARNALRTVDECNDYRHLVAYLCLPGSRTSKEVLREIIALSLGAALIVILFFTGMRCSEVLALKVGCYRQREHKTGGKYWYVTGIQAKSGGIEREWVIPMPVVRAIVFLENLHVALIGDVENQYLFAIPDGNAILPPPYVNIRRLWPSTARDVIQRFSTFGFRTSQLSSNIHPHQARKTFAQFVTLRDKSALEALAQYYGHLYTALLDGIYVGIDVQLNQLLTEEAENEMQQGLTELLSAKTLGGKAAVALQKVRDNIHDRFAGRTSITTIVRKLIKEGVVLSPCDWGYCLYSREFSACGGSDLGPNHRTREPNVCASCKNFVVSERHRQWWETRASREEKFVASEDISEQARQIALTRHSKSNEVLMSLNTAEQNG